MSDHSESDENTTDAANSAGAPAADTGADFADTAADEAAEDAAPDDAIEHLKAENAKLRDLGIRAVADLDNYRRRVAREKEELRKFATQGLLEDLVPMLDNLDIGLASAEKHPEAAPVTDGFKMIASQIRRTLEQHGLKEISPTGEPFDPNFHESVSQTAHDTIPEHHVAAVLRTGYRLHDRLVRPATVVLSTGKAAGDAAADNAAVGA